MTVQVTTTPPGSSLVLESGSIINVPPGGGVIFALLDVLPGGELGEPISFSDLLTEVVGDDLVVTCPDGTVLIFAGWLSAALDPEVAFAPEPAAGIEAELEPAAGGPGGPGGAADDGGSSGAVEAFLRSLFNEFGEAPEGDIQIPPPLPFELPDFLDPLFEDDVIPGELTLLTLDPLKQMVLEDKSLGINLPEEIGDGPITISGLPEGATVVNDEGSTLVGPGGVVAGISPEGLQIIPPLHDDKNFTVRVLQGDGETLINVEIEIMVKAVADAAKILLDRPGKEDIDIGDPEYLGGKNPVQWEMEPYLCAGHNDTPADAMDIGSLDGTNGIALTVNGWLATAEFKDVDVYKFTLTQAGRYDVDIDFGDLRHRGRPIKSNAHMGRVDDADAVLLLFKLDENGEAVLVAVNDNGGPGRDPLIDGKFLEEGMYFVAVSQSGNVDASELRDALRNDEELLFDDIFDPNAEEHGGNRRNDGDYQLQVRPDREEDDITPGHMVNLMVVEDNPMKTFDGDFEFGIFSGWSALGDAQIVGSGGNGAEPTSGDNQVLLTSRGTPLPDDEGGGEAGDPVGDAVTIEELAAFMGVEVEDLLELEDRQQDDQDPFEGSAIKGKFWVKAGQELTFDWSFLTDEDSAERDAFDGGFGDEGNDMAIVAITNDLGEVIFLGTLTEFLRVLQDDAEEPGAFDFDQQTGFDDNSNRLKQPFSFTFEKTGVFHVSIAVFDQGDDFFDSGLLIDNVAVDGKTPGSIKMLAVSGRGSDEDPGALFMVDQDNGEADRVGRDQTKPNEGPDKLGFTGLAVNQDNGEAFASSIEGEQGGRFSSLYRLDPWSGHVLGEPITMMLAVAIERVIDFGEVVSEDETYVEDGFILRARGEQPRDLDIGDFDSDPAGDSELVMHPVDGDDNSTRMRLTSADGKPFTLVSFDIEFANVEGDEDNERLQIRGFDAEGNEVASFLIAADDIAGPQTVELPPEFANVSRVDFRLRGNLEGGFEDDRVQIDNITLLSTSLAISDLAIQPETGFLYGIGAGNDEANAGKLFLIDTSTGIATVIGNPGAEAGTLGGGGLAFAPGGTLFFTAVLDDGTTPGEEDAEDTPVIMILDPNDGSVLATIETTFEGEPIFFDGLGVRPNDGVLFATRGGSDVGEEIYTIDIATGEATFVGADEGGEGGLSLSDIDFFVKPQKYLDTENKHTIEGLDLMVRDPDGTESVTFVKIDINDLSGGDDLPPGFMIGFGEIDRRDDDDDDDENGEAELESAGDGDGWFEGREDNGDFFDDGQNWVWIDVTRIDSNDPDVGPETNPELVIQDTIKVRVFYDEDEGLIFFRIPDHLRVQNVDLGGLMWKAEKSNDQDFNIEVMVRTTETHHEFSVHPNLHHGRAEDELPIVGGKTTVQQILIEDVPEGEIIHDVDLLTRLFDHSSESDLIITLTSPEGTTVTLTSENDFRGSRTLWNDQANKPVSADPGGSRKLTIESALSNFVGENPNGIWTIEITDLTPELCVVEFDGIPMVGDNSKQVYKEDDFLFTAQNSNEVDQDIQLANGGLLLNPSNEAITITYDDGKPFMLTSFAILEEGLDEGESLVVTAFNDDDEPIGTFQFDFTGDPADSPANDDNDVGTIVLPETFPPIVSKVTLEVINLDGVDSGGEFLILDDFNLVKSEGSLGDAGLWLKTIPEDQLSLVMYDPFESGEVTKRISHEPSDRRLDAEPTVDRIWVEGVKGTIKDVDLFTDISHPDSGSLAIRLISPDGTRVLIVKGEADPSNFANVFEGTTWDDQANNPVSDAVFVDGVLQPELTPESAMAAFKGEDPNGYWTIKVLDLEEDGDPREVLVFDNGLFVDTFEDVSGGENFGNAESDEIQHTLGTVLGHNVMTTVELGENLADALQGKQVFVIPEQEVNEDGLSGSPGGFDIDALNAIRTFVEEGGKLIVNGSDDGRTADLLNELFGFSLTEGRNDGLASTKTAGAAGTIFGAGPAGLDPADATNFLNGLPDGSSTSIYENGSGSTVVLFENPALGDGQIIYLGYDWNSAEGGDEDPSVGGQNGGWFDVLDLAVTMGMNGTGTLNDWSLKFTVFDGQELGVPHFYNSTTIMVNNKAVADKPMFGKLVVVDFGDGRKEILSGGEGRDNEVEGAFGPGGGDVYEEDGLNFQVYRGPVILKDVVYDEEEGSRELGLSKGDVLKITADDGQRFSFISFSVDKESFEGWQGESIKFFGFLDGELVGEFELDGDYIWTPETILLPSTFMDVDKIVLKTDFNHGLEGSYPDFAFLDDMKFKLPLMAVDVYEDNAMPINGSFEGPIKKMVGSGDDFFNDDPFAGWMTSGDVDTVGKLNAPIRTITFSRAHDSDPDVYTEDGIRFEDTRSSGFQIDTYLSDHELLIDDNGGGEANDHDQSDYFDITAEDGGRFNLFRFDLEKNELDNQYETVTLTAYRDGEEVGRYTIRHNTSNGTKVVNFLDVDKVEVHTSRYVDNNDQVKIDNIKVQLAHMAAPTDGQSQAILTTNAYDGAVSDTELEYMMGLPKDALDQLIREHQESNDDGPGPVINNGDGPGDRPANAREGSAIKVTLKLDAGDKVSFDWNMLTDEPVPTHTVDDFGFVFVLGPPETGEKQVLTSTMLDPTEFEGGAVGEYKHSTGYETFLFEVPEAGSYTFVIGVADEKDRFVKSALLVDNLSVNGWPVTPDMLTDTSSYYGAQMGVSVTDTDGSESLTSFALKYDPSSFPFKGDEELGIPPAVISVDGQTEVEVGDVITLKDVMRLDSWGEPVSGAVWAEVTRIHKDPHNGFITVEFTLDPEDRIQQINVTDEVGVLMPMHKDGTFDIWVLATATETNVSDTVELINGDVVPLDFAVFTQENDQKIRNDGPIKEGQDSDDTPSMSTITVAGVEGDIQDIDIVTLIEHEATGELKIILISPEGTEVTISNENGGDFEDLFDGTRWSDGSPNVTGFVFTVDGVVTPLGPEGPFAAFKGENPNGQWKLQVEDLSKGEMGGKAKVAVFDNADFVDTSDGGDGPGSSESDEIQNSLGDAGHKVTTFTGLTAEEINAALVGQDVLVIPELENGDVTEDGVGFDQDALDAIKAFVEAGGKLIVAGTGGPNATLLLNAIFGYDLGFDGVNGPSTFTGDEGGTVFDGGPGELDPNNATTALLNLPTEDATAIYEDANNNPTVALFTEGEGQVVYLGYDWFDAEGITQSQDPDWLTVLDIAASMGDDTTGEIDGWQVLIQTNMTKQQIEVESQTMVDTLTFKIGAVADKVEFSMVETKVMGTEDLLTNDLLDEFGNPIEMVNEVGDEYPVEALERAAQFADRSEFGLAPEGDDGVAGISDPEDYHTKHFSGSIRSPQDSDVYSFTAYAGEKIVIDLDFGVSDEDGEDPVVTKLELVGPNGELLAFDVGGADNEDEGDPEIPGDFFDSETPFMAPATGTYYVIVRSAGEDELATGDYELFISIEKDSVVVDNFPDTPFDKKQLSGGEWDDDNDWRGPEIIEPMLDVDELFSPGQPGEGIPLNFKVETPDQDGSERISALKLNGLQPGSKISFLGADGVTRHELFDEDLDGMILIDLDDYSLEGSVFADPLTGKLLFLDTGIGTKMTTVDFGVGPDRFAPQGRQEGFLFETLGGGDDDLDFANQTGPDDGERELRLDHDESDMRITVDGGDVAFAFKSFSIEDADLGPVFDLKITGFKNGHQVAELLLDGDADLLGTVELPEGFGDVDEVFFGFEVSGGNGDEHFVVLDDFQFARGGLDLRLHPADDDGDNMWVGLQVETTESMPMDPDNVKVETTWTTFMGEMQNLDFDVPGPMRQDSYEEDGFIFTPGSNEEQVGDIVTNSGGDPMKVALFFNGDFVDIEDGDGQGGGSAEALRIEEGIEAYGHDVMRFSGGEFGESETAWKEALEGKQVLVIPELELGDLSDQLEFNEDTLDVIREFIRNGGKLVIAADDDDIGDGGNAVDLLNLLFDFELEDEEVDDPSHKTDAADDTFFVNAPEQLRDNSNSSGIKPGTLPAEATTIYETSEHSTVVLFQGGALGAGAAVYLGWDWELAKPEDSQDGGWLKVLNTAITMSADKDLVLHGPELGEDSEGEDRAPIATLMHETGKPFDLISFDLEFEDLESNDRNEEIFKITGFDEFGNEIDSILVPVGELEDGPQDQTIALPATFRQVTKVVFEIEDVFDDGEDGADLGEFYSDRIQIDNIMVKGPATIDVTIKEIADDPNLLVEDIVACEDNAEHMKDEWGNPIHPVMFVDGMPMYPVPIKASVADKDGSEAITRIVVASDMVAMNVPMDGIKFLIGDQVIGPLDEIVGRENAVEIQVLGSGFPDSGQTRFDAEAYADQNGNLIIEIEPGERAQEVDLSFMKVMLPQHKDGKFTFDVEVRSTEIEIFRLDFNHPEGVGNETFYAEQGFEFTGQFARGDTAGDGDLDRELILPNESTTGAIASLVAQDGEPFNLFQFDVDFESIEFGEGEFLKVTGFDSEGNAVADFLTASVGTKELPDSFRGVSRVEFELVDPTPTFSGDRIHIDNVIVGNTPGDGPNAVNHAVTHDSFMLTVLPVADKAMVGEPIIVQFGEIDLGNPSRYQESGMVFRKTNSRGFDIDNSTSSGDEAELDLHGSGGHDEFSIEHESGEAFSFHSFELEALGPGLGSSDRVFIKGFEDGEEVDGAFLIIDRNTDTGTIELPGAFANVDRVEFKTTANHFSEKFTFDDMRFKVPLDMVMVHEDNAMPVIGEPQNIAVFDDSDFVDTSGGSAEGDEADEIRDSLVSLGHSALAFDNDNSAGAWQGVLAGKDVLVIPELQNASFGAIQALAADVGAVIRAFVMAGGKLIIAGEDEGKAASFLNEVFALDGLNLVEAEIGDSGSGVIDKAAGADGTPFVMGPDSLQENDLTSGLLRSSLPSEAKSAYETVDDDTTYSVVTQIPIGMGKITYLGWDWYDGDPSPGDQDGGWLQILDLAARDTMMWVDKGSNYDIPLKAEVVDKDGSESLTKIKLTLTDADGETPEGLAWTYQGEPIEDGQELTFINSDFIFTPNGEFPHAVATIDGNMLILEFADQFRFQKVELSEIGIELAEHLHGEFTIDYSVMTKETNPMLEGVEFKDYAETATISDSFTFIVGAVADKPIIDFLGDNDDRQVKQSEIEFAMQTGVNDSGATAQELGSLGGASDQVSVGGVIAMSADDVDFYRFTLTQDATVYFDIDMAGSGGASDFDAQLSLFAEDGTQIVLPQLSTDPDEAGADDDGSVFALDVEDPTGFHGTDPFFDIDLAAGTYYVAVSSWNVDPDFDGNNQSGGFGTSSGDYMLQIRTELDDIETTMLTESGPLEKLGTEALVNVDGTLGEQANSDIAALAGGGYVVVWQGVGIDTNFQIYDADGNPVGNNTLAVNTGSTIANPSVVGLADGRFIISYSNDDAEGIGVFAQIFNPNGTLSVAEFQVNTFEGTGADDDLQTIIKAAALVGINAGKVVFAWQSEDDESGDDGSNIILRIFDAASDSFITGEDQVNDISVVTSDNEQVQPEVAGLSNGGYVVLWVTENDGNVFGIRGEVFDASGVQVGAGGSDLDINSDSNGFQLDPAVAGLKDGGFVAVWADSGGSETVDSFDIVARIFDNDGNEVVADFLVNTTTASIQAEPDVTALMDGGFLVTWQSGAPGARDILAQRFDSDGNKVGEEFLVHMSNTVGDQFDSAAAGLTDGDLVITWSDDGGQAVDNEDIFVQNYEQDLPEEDDGNPMVMGEEETPISLPFKVSTPDVDGSEGLIDLKISGFPVVETNPEGLSFGANGVLTYINNLGHPDAVSIGVDGVASFSLAQYASTPSGLAEQLGITQVEDLGGLGSKKVVMVDTGPSGINLKYVPPEGAVTDDSKQDFTITFLGFDGDVPFYSEDGFILRAEDDGFSGVEDLDIEELEAGDSAMRMHPDSSGPSTKFSLEAENGEAFCLHDFDIVRENLESGESLVIKAFDEFGMETASLTIDFTGNGSSSQDNNDTGNIDLTGNSDFEDVHRVEFTLTGDLFGGFSGDAAFFDNFNLSQVRPTTLEVTVNSQEMFAPGKVMEQMQTVEIDLVVKEEGEGGEVDPEGPEISASDDKVFTNDGGRIEIPLKALLANDQLDGGGPDQPGFSFEIVSGSYSGSGAISIDGNGTAMQGDDTVVIDGVDPDAVHQFQYRITNSPATATALVMITHASGLLVEGDPTMSSILIADDSAASAQTLSGGTGDDFFIVEHDKEIEIVDDGGSDTALPSLDGDGGGGSFEDPFVFELASGFGPGNGVETIDGSMFPNDVVIRDPSDSSTSGWVVDFSGTELKDIAGIEGLAGDDSIVGSDGNDVINGGPGSDIIEGGDGNDTIFGGTGTDLVDGGEGDDLLVAFTEELDNGVKFYTGGAGEDIFHAFGIDFFDDGSGVNKNIGAGILFIADFTPGEDILRIDSDFAPSLADLDNMVGSGSGQILFTDNGVSTSLAFMEDDGVALDNDTFHLTLSGITGAGNGAVGGQIDNFTELGVILQAGTTPIDFV